MVAGFIVQALKGEPITIFGDGRQTRSFCYVDDLIEGLIRFMDSDSEFVGPVNLGNPAELSILSLAETILRLTGSRSELTFKPLPENDPRQRQPDIGLARKMLDWEPECKLEDGLIKTIEYFDLQLRNGFVMGDPPALKIV